MNLMGNGFSPLLMLKSLILDFTGYQIQLYFWADRVILEDSVPFLFRRKVNLNFFFSAGG